MSQEAWIGVKDEFEAAGLGGEEARGLARAMGRVVVEQDADQHTRRVGCVELLQEGYELTTAMALGYGMMNNAGREVDGGRQRHCSEPLEFVVALDGGMLVWLWRQSGAVVAIA